MKLFGKLGGVLFILVSAGISLGFNNGFSGHDFNLSTAIQPNSETDFEKLRLKFSGWLHTIETDFPFTSSKYVKEWVLSDWDMQQDDYQIISVREKDEFSKGHIPNAINIPFEDILLDTNIDKLDSMMTHIIYSDTAHTSVTASVLFNLLDYKAYNLRFNTKDWNLSHSSGKTLDNKSSYITYTGKDTVSDTYKLPISNRTNMALNKLIVSRYVSNISNKNSIISSDKVKNIIDNWDQNKDRYQIVSVLSKSDFEVAHIPHSINIPIFNLMKPDQLKRIDPNKITLLYCKSGNFAQVSSTLLNLLGYNAVNIRYGMMDWNSISFAKADY